MSRAKAQGPSPEGTVGQERREREVKECGPPAPGGELGPGLAEVEAWCRHSFHYVDMPFRGETKA